MRIAATGHRPHKMWADFKHPDDLMSTLQNVAHEYIMEHINTITRAISGMALGWDQAWALEALEAGIPLTAAIPCADQDIMWRLEDRKLYKEILRKARKVVVVSPGSYAPWKMHARNKWMVMNSDRVVALWNGDKTGGTAACVKLVKPGCLDNLWPQYLQLQQAVNPTRSR